MKANIKENLKPVIFIVIVLVLTAISAHPQRKFTGTIVDVLDGKTCVIDLPSGKLTVVLQYIEIPEPEQPLHQTVKDHLQALVLNKKVEFLPNGVMKTKTVGQIYVKGVDVSQQMIRDGAAWYLVSENQDESEALLYKNNEAQAKAEKRGVWGVPGLKPAWEYRAEQAALRKKVEEEAAAKAALASEQQNERRKQEQQKKLAQRPAKPLGDESFLWSETEEQLRLSPNSVIKMDGLLVSHNPSGKSGFIATPDMKLEILNDETDAPVVKIGMGYFYSTDREGDLKTDYVIGVGSESKEFRFLKNNTLVLTVDEERIEIGKAKRVAQKGEAGVRESLSFSIKREVLERVSNAKSVRVKLGTYNAKISGNIQQSLKNLLKTM